MPSKKDSDTTNKASASAQESVETFLASLDHPSRQEILSVRQIILAADPTIAEGIKWKVPSVRTSEWFATMNLHVKTGIGVVLHFGAKTNENSRKGVSIADPDSLLVWLAKDRAVVTFRDLNDIAARRSAFTDLIRQWIKHV